MPWWTFNLQASPYIGRLTSCCLDIFHYLFWLCLEIAKLFNLCTAHALCFCQPQHAAMISNYVAASISCEFGNVIVFVLFFYIFLQVLVYIYVKELFWAVFVEAKSLCPLWEKDIIVFRSRVLWSCLNHFRKAGSCNNKLNTAVWKCLFTLWYYRRTVRIPAECRAKKRWDKGRVEERQMHTAGLPTF